MMASIPLHRLLADGRAAEHPVCHDGARVVPWREFAARVAACRDVFAAREETRWLLVSDDALDFAVRLLALLHAGKQPVIPPNSRPGTLNELAGAFDAVADMEMPAMAARSSLAPLDPRSATIDIFTSGSAGQPKQVRKTLNQLEAEIGTLESLWGDRVGDAAVVSTAPCQHFYGMLFRLLWPLSAGRPFDRVTCAHPDSLAERLALLGNTVLVSNPAHLARLPELVALATLQPPPRLVFSSGGPLPAAAAAIFHRDMGAAPTEVFGSTETGGIAWRRQEPDDAWTRMPGMLVAAAEDGALLLCSPFLETGAATPWRADDAVEILPDGRFRLRGRLDRVVKIEEKRVSLPSLEARLAEHPWVRASAAVPLAGRRQQLGAALVLNGEGRAHIDRHGRRATAQALRRHLAAHFDAVLIPRRWRFVEQLPMNERGKLTHAAVAALFASDAEGES
ncbi:MAG: AMP-binding protein [Ignavibacteria bacterium]